MKTLTEDGTIAILVLAAALAIYTLWIAYQATRNNGVAGAQLQHWP